MPKTGATRYQKFLKSEKSKTKLKAKKDLPKGTNVTKTNFKVKKIVIKEQLKKHEISETLSTRKLNLKDLLSRINHFNVQARTVAIDDLGNLITSHPEIVKQNLGPLIHGVTPLLLNVEKIIRREALKVVHSILSNAAEEDIEPFHDFMSTYLRSAMTHIDLRIQEDALLFLDTLLMTSQRISKDFHKVLPNFLDMISKLRIDSRSGRTLTVNLNSEMTTAKWRVKVLYRLQSFLHKYVEYYQITDPSTAAESITHKFNSGTSYPLLNQNYIGVCELSCFSAKPVKDDFGNTQTEEEKFQSYIETLIPLLLETWLEVCSSANKDKNIETVVSEDTAILLKHILEVILLIWQVVKYLNKKNPSSNIEHDFCMKYKQSFSKHIFEGFPYVTNLRMKKSKTAKEKLPFEDSITDTKLVLQNLKICHLYIILNPNVNPKTQIVNINALLSYLERIFSDNNNEDVNNYVMAILHTLFGENFAWAKNITLMESLFQKLVDAYFNPETPRPFHEKIFALLCKITLNTKLSQFHMTRKFEEWLKKLPDILLHESVTVQTIDIIHMFAVRNNKLFNEVVKTKLLNIVQNLPKINITDSKKESVFQKLFSLLCWIKCWDDTSLNLLEQQLINGEYKSEHSKYIFDILRLRSGCV